MAKAYVILEKGFNYNDEGYDLAGFDGVDSVYLSEEKANKAIIDKNKQFIKEHGENGKYGFGDLFAYIESVDDSFARDLEEEFPDVFDGYHQVGELTKECIERIADNVDFFEVVEVKLNG